MIKVRKKLYRKNNSTAHGSTKKTRDYTPLFMFLLSRVGKKWDEIYSEVITRLPSPDPIYHMVARDRSRAVPYIRYGESSYYSGLYIDAEGILQKVDKALDNTTMTPSCKCCTHTFNGKPFTKKYQEE